MKSVFANLCVILVDKTAIHFNLLAVRMGNDDVAAIGDSEKLIIIAVDKANPLCRLFHVSVQQIGNIGIAIEIVIAGCGNTAQKIGVFFGVNPIPVFTAEISHKPPIGTGAAVFQHRITVSQDTHLVKFLDNGIKLGGKFVRPVLLDLILIIGIKGIAAVSEISAHKGIAAAL